MGIKKAMSNFLRQSTGVSAVLDDRIFFLNAPTKSKLPYVVFETISSPGTHHMGGQSEIANPTFQFSCFGKTGPEAEAAKEAIRNAIVGFRGLWDDVIISSVLLQDESDEFDPPDDGSEDGTFSELMDITIWYKRPKPTFF